MTFQLNNTDQTTLKPETNKNVDISKAFTDDQIESIKNLLNGHTFKESKGFNLRLGENGHNKLSKYSTLKRWDFSDDLYNFISENEPSYINARKIQTWFIKYEKGGFLDKMINWVEKAVIVRIAAIPLQDTSNLFIDSKQYNLRKGDMITFSIRLPHEVKKVVNQEDWLCYMYFPLKEVTYDNETE
jgi:hypothetical protein